MRKSMLRILALTVAASFAAFSVDALAKVTTPPPAYAQRSARSQSESVVARVEGWFAHPKSEGPSKLDPTELNHMYQCNTPICRGAR